MKHILIISTLFICITNSMHGMENILTLVNVFDTSSSELQREPDYTHLSVEAENYNQNNPLLCKDILNQILSHCLVTIDEWEAVEANIKNFMRLRLVCKNFNKWLTAETIGSFCKFYKQRVKDALLCRLSLVDNYHCSCIAGEKGNCPELILLCAGATIFDFTNNLYEAVLRKNVLRIESLLKHYTNPNLKYCGDPIFFYVTKVEMAQVFIDNGVDVHAISDYGKANVLWTIASSSKYPAELMQLYLIYGG